jgi:hypothetical protein
MEKGILGDKLRDVFSRPLHEKHTGYSRKWLSSTGWTARQCRMLALEPRFLMRYA